MNYRSSRKIIVSVIPAKAGIQRMMKFFWIPACAGMTSIIKRYFLFRLHLLLLTSCFLLLVSCGYSMVGSKLLPFDSITIKHVKNKTYEPRLEERLHNALSNEFLNQGIEVRSSGGDVELEATVTDFRLGAIGAVDEKVKEQELVMFVDIRLTDHERVTEIKSMRSPIKITFQATGTVADSVAYKERAADKASEEIAKEIVGQIFVRYAK